MFNTDPGSLWWESFEIGDVQIITIDEDKGDGFALWRSDELTLRLAAPELLERAEDLLGMLSSLADEHAVCRELIDEAKELRAAIKKAKG